MASDPDGMKEKTTALTARLVVWARENRMLTPGAVCVALVVTRNAKRLGLPLEEEGLLTGRGGQILDLGKRMVQTILADHGVKRVLAVAGGRTSRGNVHKMRSYVAWLNANACDSDLTTIENGWVGIAERTAPYQPQLRLSVDPKLSLRMALRKLLEQAGKCKDLTGKDGTARRQQGVLGEPALPGLPAMFPSRRTDRGAGSTDEIVLRHLVGAKLELVLGRELEAHGAFVADAVTDRSGDYQIEDVVVHVTTSPGEALLRKCSDNLDQGLRPLIITTFKNVAVADTMAENAGVAGRIEIFDVEQFVASNILELSMFKAAGQRVTVLDLITHYNRRAECENNPGLLIKGA